MSRIPNGHSYFFSPSAFKVGFIVFQEQKDLQCLCCRRARNGLSHSLLDSRTSDGSWHMAGHQQIFGHALPPVIIYHQSMSQCKFYPPISTLLPHILRNSYQATFLFFWMYKHRVFKDSNTLATLGKKEEENL